MKHSEMKPFWIAGVLSFILFLVLFGIRAGFYERIFQSHDLASESAGITLPDMESWMNIFQNAKKIGYSHSTFSKTDTGFHLTEELFMRINTMGFTQDLKMTTTADVFPDLSLSAFDFNITSSRFRFSAKGKVNNTILTVQTESEGVTQRLDIEMQDKPYLSAGIMQAVINAAPAPGDRFVFNVFDPATMSQQPVIINVKQKTEIRNMGILKPATRVTIQFKGTRHQAWVGEDGEILKEKGILGITLVRTTPTDAVSGTAVESSEDLTKFASIPSNIQFDDPAKLNTLKVKIIGIPLNAVSLDGERQTLTGDMLTIQKESLSGLKPFNVTDMLDSEIKVFLNPTPFIQSNKKEILNVVKDIVDPNDPPEIKAKKILDWVYKHIEKRPVISVPDAISTLKNRMGDCNEHAVLMAALARGAGIPAKVETGLVYLNGRFYYHAWNLLYLGKWITADSVFGQMPADVTHIRFTSGGQDQQLDLMGVIGKLQIKVIESM